MEYLKSLGRILNIIVSHAEHLLVKEMEIETRFDGKYHMVEKIILKKYTTMIGIGGTVNMLFYATYDDLLLDNLTRKFLDETVSEEEFNEFRESTAGEIANIIIGSAIPDFPDKGKGVTMTPPITIEDGKSIIKTAETQIITASLFTPYGNIELNVVGSEKE